MKLVSSELQHSDILTKNLAVAPFNAHAEILINSTASILVMKICSLWLRSRKRLSLNHAGAMFAE